MKILVTGCAGFIGFYIAKRLLEEGHNVVGIDNLNDYYDVNLKKARLQQLEAFGQFTFQFGDITDYKLLAGIFEKNNFDRVIHMAAQAGVRYSLENPHVYIQSNLVGFTNILELCRHAKIPHLVYASSSSVYGSNTKVPFSTHDNVDHPISLYAATKKSNELMAHTYSHLYQLPTTGLRFFTVYGPWGRPDMAGFKFAKAMMQDEELEVYNEGKMKRDFTYIDDIVEGVVRVMNTIPKGNKEWDAMNPDPSTSRAPYKVYNIGNNKPVELMDFISTLEKILKKKAKLKMLPLQAGDVPATFANIDDLIADVGFAPSTPIEVGLQRFVAWYQEYTA